MENLKKNIKFCLFLMVGILFFGRSFSYLEEKLFCSLKDDEITLYFSETEDSKKCSSYLHTVESKMNDTYEELEDIFRHIQNKQDLPYWTKLFKNKQQIFLMLGNVKKQILEKMEQFEQTLFHKYQAYLAEDLLLRKFALQYQINRLTWEIPDLTGNSSLDDTVPIDNREKEEKNLGDDEDSLDPESELAFLLFQKDQIEKIETATSLQELVEAVKQYFNGQKINNETLNH